MNEMSQSDKSREWPSFGWALFIMLHAGCVLVWAYVFTGHISSFERIWSYPSTLLRVTSVVGPFACLFLLHPSMGLNRFGRGILTLYVCWALLMAVIGLVHAQIPLPLLQVLLVLAPITVQGISIGILMRSRRRA